MIRSDSFKILITSAGRRVALVKIFRAALEELSLDGEILAADVSRSAPAWHVADRGVIVPRFGDPEFIPEMRRLCEKENVGLLIPIIDPELDLWAANRDAFARSGTAVMISTPETIEICNDKQATSEFFHREQFPTVRQTSADRAVQEWAFPFLVKPRFGGSSTGVCVVRDAEEAAVALRPSVGRKPSVLDSGDDYLAQSIAPGVEYTVDVYVDRAGRARCAVPRKRLAVRDGEVAKGMTVRLKPVMDLATRIAEALPGAYGVLNIQIFHDASTGEMNVIEINPRFGGGFPLAWEAGARYATWLIEEALGREPSVRTDWRDRLVMLRWDDAVFLDADEAGL